MTMEENYASLYRALYNAIRDPKLIGDLLQHPEFIRKAGQICHEIAGHRGGEELFQEACLRVLECASDLNPNSIPSEGAFFRWFSRLARLTHLSSVLSAAAVNSCTEAAGLWPDSTDDVPPDDMDRFLAHADACPYHMRILCAEDEAMRAAFNRARGLDSQGRILLGEELKASVAEHRRRLQSWREAVSKKRTPFAEVALFNGGVKVASCGKFYNFSKHKSRNELDPYAGLQICGMSDDNPDESVLLGFYALAGMCHTGKEHRLELENGYTVCLKMKAHGETTFDIEFRCVETEKLEPEPDEENENVVTKEPPDGGPMGVSPVTTDQPVPLLPGPSVPPGLDGWWPLPRSVQAGALFALLLLVTFSVLPAGKRWGQMEMGDPALAKVPQTPVDTIEAGSTPSTVPPAEAHVSPTPAEAAKQSTPVLPAQRPTKIREGLQPPKDGGRRPSGSSLPTSLARSTPEPARNSKPSAKASTHPEEPLNSAVARLAAATSPANHRPSRALSTTAKSGAEVTDLRSTTQLLSYSGQGQLNDKSARQIRTAAGRRHAGAAYPHDNSVLNIATTDVMAGKLSRALKDAGLHVKPVVDQHSAVAKYRVVWDARESWGRGSLTVTLNVFIFKEGETNSAEHLSYKVTGNSRDAAYDGATRMAVTEVLKWIRSGSRNHQSASGSGLGEATQSQPTL